MKGKITDTNQSINEGGRVRRYWESRNRHKSHRSERSTSSEYNMDNVELMKIKGTYSIKGFEFGNWVNEEDRCDFMVASDRALKELSKIIHSKNIGMDYLVGVAFGARGVGGSAAAHYEPAYNMINLTKSMGEGSLAHEYGHAIDYNFGMRVDQNKRYSALTGGDSTARYIKDNEGAQFRYYANMIVDYIKNSKSYERIQDESDYWRRRNEIFGNYSDPIN